MQKRQCTVQVALSSIKYPPISTFKVVTWFFKKVEDECFNHIELLILQCSGHIDLHPGKFSSKDSAPVRSTKEGVFNVFC